MTQQYPPPQQPPAGWTPAPQYAAPPPPEPKNGLGLTALILGLIGLLFGIVPLTGFVAVGLGITGIALGLFAFGRIRKGRATNKKTTIAGLVASVAALAVGIWGITIMFGAVDQLDKDLSSLGGPDTVTESEEPAAAEPEPVVPEPVAPVEEEPVEESPPADTIEKLAVGATGTLSENDAEVGEITVTKVTKTTKAQDEYSDPPKNGQFWIFTVTAKASGSEVFTVNPFDFYLVDAEGNHYDASSGSSYYFDSGGLDHTELNAGEKTQGRFAIDGPKGATQVAYAPGSRALCYWTLSKS